MRVVQNVQMQIGEVDVSKISLDPNSRDDIPQILIGLQHLHADLSTREKLFQLLREEIAPTIDKNNGRPGMTLWSIFVSGVIRLCLNIDYDRLHNLVHRHMDIREMMGHGLVDKVSYACQTLKDNVKLFTPELLDKVNQIVVSAGHALINKKGEALRGRCDSFVVETNVDYPTDITLLFEALRKVIELTARLATSHGLNDWMQYAHHLRKLKRCLRAAQSTKQIKARSDEKQEKNKARVIEAHEAYLDIAQSLLTKAKITLDTLAALGLAGPLEVVAKLEIEGYMAHAERQIDQTRRRVILGEVIPHAEKVFSIFQPHTEWISKGKAGVPVELGLRTCILEDQFKFILHHMVMQKQTDDQVAVPMVEEAKRRFPTLKACSFDKGFHSPENQTALTEHLTLVALPRKGKLSQQAQAVENDKEFVEARRKHSAVESAINGLEVHGLDRCLDHGLDGFKRYVALAVVAQNIYRIGAIIRKLEIKRANRKQRGAYHDTRDRLAA